MTFGYRLDTDPQLPVLAGLAPSPVSAIPWGELSVDQPDGFGTVSEPELPAPAAKDTRA